VLPTPAAHRALSNPFNGTVKAPLIYRPDRCLVLQQRHCVNAAD
jgi:hypothetical protein